MYVSVYSFEITKQRRFLNKYILFEHRVFIWQIILVKCANNCEPCVNSFCRYGERLTFSTGISATHCICLPPSSEEEIYYLQYLCAFLTLIVLKRFTVYPLKIATDNLIVILERVNDVYTFKYFEDQQGERCIMSIAMLTFIKLVLSRAFS